MFIKAAILLALVALTATGCGSNESQDGGIASAGGTPTAAVGSSTPAKSSEAEAALAFARCMRENGLPKMADPKIDENGEVQMDLDAGGVDPAKVKAAEEKCKKLLPNGGQPKKMDPERLEKLRAFARCMRDNGLPDFPDPTENGMQVDGNKFPPTDPKVKAAEQKCAQYKPEGGKPQLDQGGS